MRKLSYGHLTWIEFFHTSQLSSAKWLRTTISHEPSLQFVQLGTRMMYLGNAIHKGPSGFASVDSCSSYLFNYISTNGPSWNSQNKNYPEHTLWIRQMITQRPSCTTLPTCRTNYAYKIRLFMLLSSVYHIAAVPVVLTRLSYFISLPLTVFAAWASTLKTLTLDWNKEAIVGSGNGLNIFWQKRVSGARLSNA